MQRWEQIADYINTQLALDVPADVPQERISSSRNLLVDPKQHAERVKQANQAPPPPVDGWTADQQKQLEHALRGLPRRWRRTTVVFHCGMRSRASRSATARALQRKPARGVIAAGALDLLDAIASTSSSPSAEPRFSNEHACRREPAPKRGMTAAASSRVSSRSRFSPAARSRVAR